MENVDSGNLVKRILAWIARVTIHPVFKSDSTDKVRNETRPEHACSGGYNEAFIFEYWASYNPRH